MASKFLPKITLSVSDRVRLQRLASSAAAERHSTADFLLAEIGRAEIVPDEADALEAIVTMGSSVSYRLNWSSPAVTRTLVYPEECASDRSHVSVLSPLGASLIGLRRGSRMPYLTIQEWITLSKSSRSAPDVIPLSPSARDVSGGDESGDYPGPSAA